MGTANTPEIYDLLEKAGYDCDTVSDEDWEDFNSDFESECEDFLKEQIELNKRTIITEWAFKTGVKKKVSQRSE